MAEEYCLGVSICFVNSQENRVPQRWLKAAVGECGVSIKDGGVNGSDGKSGDIDTLAVCCDHKMLVDCHRTPWRAVNVLPLQKVQINEEASACCHPSVSKVFVYGSSFCLVDQRRPQSCQNVGATKHGQIGHNT